MSVNKLISKCQHLNVWIKNLCQRVVAYQRFIIFSEFICLFAKNLDASGLGAGSS